MITAARGPLLALSCAALVPAAALAGLALYARDKAQPAKVAVAPATVPQQLPAPLASPLLSVRRAPAALAADG